MTQPDISERLGAIEARLHSPEDLALFKEMARTYRGVQEWGRFSRLIVITLGSVAAFIASWDTAINKINEWFK